MAAGLVLFWWALVSARPAGATGRPQPAPRAPQQVLLGTGRLLARPEVQLVRLGDVPQGEALQTFLLAWQKSAAWGAMTAEYGVGPLRVRAPLDLPNPFTSPVADVDADSSETPESAMETWIRTLARRDATRPPAPAAAGAQSQLPLQAEEPQVLYVLALPQGLVASPQADLPDACQAHVWAWHSATALRKDGRLWILPYVVLPDCPAVATAPAAAGAVPMAAVDRKTAALSHALVQAITNPAAQGLQGVDPAHVAAEVLSEGSEVGTLCTQALHASSTWLARPPDMPFAVARTWSNQASLAGNMPCVPALPEEDYLRVEPVLEQTVLALLEGGSRTVPTPGLSLAAGDAADVVLQWLGRGASAAPSTLTVAEVGSSDLTLTLSKDSGQPNDFARLKVALLPEPKHGQQVVRLTAQQGSYAFSTYFLVREGPAAGAPPARANPAAAVVDDVPQMNAQARDADGAP